MEYKSFLAILFGHNLHISLSVFLGFFANILSNIAFIPQIIKSFHRKCVEDVSITMFIMLFITQICWIIYSIPIHATQLWVSSLTEIFLLIPIFIMWIYYHKVDQNPLEEAVNL